MKHIVSISRPAQASVPISAILQAVSAILGVIAGVLGTKESAT